jgi:hypothetical protein
MSISDSLAMLTPGSTFVNKKGRTAKLLFVTNTSLPAHVIESYPPQVIYANENAEIFNRDLDDFIKKYKFYNVDPELESRLDNLLIFSENDPTMDLAAEQDDEDLLSLPASQIGLTNSGRTQDAVPQAPQTMKIVADALVVEDEEEGLLLPPQAGDDEVIPNATKLRAMSAALQVKFNTLSGSLVNSQLPARLSHALVAYGQEPEITQSLIIHRLTFALDSELTLEVLQNLFRPAEDDSDTRHTIDVFEVQTAFSSERIIWTSYLGVFPDFNKNGLYATVMVGTDEFPSIQEEPRAEAQAQTFNTLYGEGQQDGITIVGTLETTLDLPAPDEPEVLMPFSMEETSVDEPSVLPAEIVEAAKTWIDSHAAEPASTEVTTPQANTNFGITISPSAQQLFDQSGTDIPGAL